MHHPLTLPLIVIAALLQSALASAWWRSKPAATWLTLPHDSNAVVFNSDTAMAIDAPTTVAVCFKKLTKGNKDYFLTLSAPLGRALELGKTTKMTRPLPTFAECHQATVRIPPTVRPRKTYTLKLKRKVFGWLSWTRTVAQSTCFTAIAAAAGGSNAPTTKKNNCLNRIGDFCQDCVDGVCRWKSNQSKSVPLSVPMETRTPSMVRMLTYNFYLRPVVKENYSDFRRGRIQKFAKHYMAAYDVIAFQEVFTDVFKRQILRVAIQHGFKYFVSGPGMSAWPFKATDSGLLIISSIVYRAGVRSDAIAAKGAVHVRIALTDSLAPDMLAAAPQIDVVTTHLQASYESTALEDKTVVSRKEQLIELRRFLDSLRQSNEDRPLFLLGDLNVDGNDANDAAEFQRFKQILTRQSFEQHDFGATRDWIDLVAEANNGRHPATYGVDGKETLLTHQGSKSVNQALDFIFYLPASSSDGFTIGDTSIEPFELPDGPSCTYWDPKQQKGLAHCSDHHGVSTVINIQHPLTETHNNDGKEDVKVVDETLIDGKLSGASVSDFVYDRCFDAMRCKRRLLKKQRNIDSINN